MVYDDLVMFCSSSENSLLNGFHDIQRYSRTLYDLSLTLLTKRVWPEHRQGPVAKATGTGSDGSHVGLNMEVEKTDSQRYS